VTPKRNARRTAPTVPIRARSTPTSTSNVRENFFRIHASISRSTGRTAAVPLERRARIPAATSENRVATDGDVPYVRPSSTAVMMNVVAITSKTPEQPRDGFRAQWHRQHEEAGQHAPVALDGPPRDKSRSKVSIRAVEEDVERMKYLRAATDVEEHRPRSKAAAVETPLMSSGRYPTPSHDWSA